jgi:hypothetical protein
VKAQLASHLEGRTLHVTNYAGAKQPALQGLAGLGELLNAGPLYLEVQ